MVLIDPGVLLLPDQRTNAAYIEYFKRVASWGSDGRIRIGYASHRLLIDHFGKHGYPNDNAPSCPPTYPREALRTLMGLLSRPATSRPATSVSHERKAPDVRPKYVRDPDAERAIALDLSAEWPTPPLGLASDECHWTPRAPTRVELDPPPPAFVHLIWEAGAEFPEERTRKATRWLRDRHITIVGGLKTPRTIDKLVESYGVDRSHIRWIESEPGSEPRLDALRSMRSHIDVMCCILGCKGQVGLGHAGSEKARRIARNLGVPSCHVKRPSEVPDALCSLHDRLGPQ